MTERALRMLKLLLKTRQNDYAEHTRMGNGTESTYALRSPVRAVAGHVAHGKRGQYYGNAMK